MGWGPPKPRWVPVALATATRGAWAPGSTFPPAELWNGLFSEMDASLFPVPLPPRPVGKTAHSRGRRRLRYRREVWRESTNFLAMLNILDKGKVGSMTECKRVTGGPPVSSPMRQLAHRQVYGVAYRESARLVRARLCLGKTGAQSISTLLRTEPLDQYGMRFARSDKHAELISHLIDEPDHQRVVNMLDALPPEEAAYYASEKNVLDAAGKSQQMFNDLQEQYGFIGGSLTEYVAYFSRKDLPGNPWAWTHEDDVKAIAGFCVVRKKSGRLRKLLMQCATNFMWEDVRDRANHGLMGGAALGSIHVPADAIEVAGFHESSAFTAVEVPDWMTFWVCAPPVGAALVWNRLPGDLRARVARSGWVFPRYRRLAMGSPHSVHILMCINVTIVGRSLVESRRLASDLATKADPALSDPARDADDDAVFYRRQRERRLAPIPTVDVGPPSSFPASGSHFTVQQFLTAVRQLRCAERRIFVVLHLFAGRPRDGDVEDWALRKADEADLPLFFTSVDIEVGADWGLAEPQTLHSLAQAVDEGLIDVLFGGPPCSTWARARYLSRNRQDLHGKLRGSSLGGPLGAPPAL